MATSSSTPITALLLNNHNTHNYKNLTDAGQCSFLPRNNFQTFSSTRSSKKDLFIRRVTPEVAGYLLSSNPLAGTPEIGDNPWLGGIVGLTVGVSLTIQRLVELSDQIEAASKVVEKLAGRVKKFVTSVENFAEDASDDGADKVSDLMDKVQELHDKLEEYLERDKKTGKA